MQNPRGRNTFAGGVPRLYCIAQRFIDNPTISQFQVFKCFLIAEAGKVHIQASFCVPIGAKGLEAVGMPF